MKALKLQLDRLILQRGRISQVACVTSDLEGTAMDWVRLTGAGPIFCGQFLNKDYSLRGVTSTCLIDVAFGYLGDMQLQIVAPLDDEPSIYSEILERCGGGVGMHHLLVLTDDIEVDLAAYREKGVGVAAEVKLLGMHLAFLDTVEELGLFVELFQMTPYFDDFFPKVHRAHLEWDGKDPIRRHPLGSD